MCQWQLVQLQKSLPEFERLGAKVVAVSVDDVPTMQKTVRQLGLTYPVISDAEARIVKLYDVLHPDEGVSRPATFIIDKRGVIRYVHIGKDFRDRPPVAKLLNIVRWL
ncbi:MAG: peroxiredoxin family protein [Nitrospinota bacterium]